MSGDDDQPPPITTSEVQEQLDGQSKEKEEMVASISTLVKAITPKDNAAAQSGSDGIMNPQMVPDIVTDPRRAQDTELVKEGNGYTDHKADYSSTYPIPETTSAFLKVIWRGAPSRTQLSRKWLRKIQ